MDEQRSRQFWEKLAAFRDTLPADERDWVNALVAAAFAAEPDVQGHGIFPGGRSAASVPPLLPPPPVLGFNLGGISEPTTIYDPQQPSS